MGYNLLNAVSALGGTRVPFTVYKTGLVNHLVISSSPAPVAAEIEKETKVKPFLSFQGSCSKEEGTLVFFTVAEPTDARQKALVGALRAKHCPNSSNVELRQLKADATGDGTAATPPPATTVKSDPTAKTPGPSANGGPKPTTTVKPSATTNPPPTTATSSTNPPPTAKTDGSKGEATSTSAPDLAALEKQLRGLANGITNPSAKAKIDVRIDKAVAEGDTGVLRQLVDLVKKVYPEKPVETPESDAAARKQKRQESVALATKVTQALRLHPQVDTILSSTSTELRTALAADDHDKLRALAGKLETETRADEENKTKAAIEQARANGPLKNRLSEADRKTLSAFPPQIIANVQIALKKIEGGLTPVAVPGKSAAEIELEITTLKTQLAKEEADADIALAANKAAAKIRDANPKNVDLFNAQNAKAKAAANLYEETWARIYAGRETLKASESALETRKLAEQKARDDARRARRADNLLRGAIRFGTLFEVPADPDAVPGLTDAQRQARRARAVFHQRAVNLALENFRDHPELTATTLEIIADAEHPEVVARAIPTVAKLRDGNFSGTASGLQSPLMAANALKMAGLIGGDFNARLTAYYDSDAPKHPDPVRKSVATTASGKPRPYGDILRETMLKYTAAFGGAMLGADGTIQAGADTLRPLRDHLHFHPDSLRRPMVNLSRHVENFRGQMGKADIRKACNDALAEIKTAPPPSTVLMVRASLGLTGGANVNAQSAKLAVLSAALTPLTQGQAGSCFATCNCMDYQENRPDEFFGDLCRIVRTGQLEKGGETMPVTTNSQPGENRLLRGLEYTVASLGASRADSGRRKQLSGHARQALAGLKDQPMVKNLTPALARLQSDLAKAEAAEKAADLAVDANFKTRKEKYDAHLTATGEARAKLIAEAQALDAARPALEEDLAAKQEAHRNLKTRAATATTRTLDALAEMTSRALSFEYDPTIATSGGGTASDGHSTSGGWQLRGANGGARIDNETQLKAQLAAEFTRLLPPGSNPEHITAITSSPGFLNGLTNPYVRKTKPSGQVEQTGSIYQHRVGGTERESKEVLSQSGTTTGVVTEAPADGATDGEKATALLVGLLGSGGTPDGKEITLGVEGVHAERALPTHPSLDRLRAGGTVSQKVAATFAQTRTRATTPMAPEEIELLVDKSVRGSILGFLGDRDPGFDLSKPPFSGSLKPAELKTAIVKAIPADLIAEAHPTMTPEQVGAQLKLITQKLDSMFKRELFPQFVVADTNWGTGESKTFHVISADLETGEPRLFSQDEATGDLDAEGDDFLNTKWTQLTTTA